MKKILLFMTALLLVAPLVLPTTLAQSISPPVFQKSPWTDFLNAHKEVENPLGIPGGPVTYRIVQQDGPANFILPGKRVLDPNLFGTVDDPRGTEAPPVLIGVPPQMREVQDGQLLTNFPNPFSDNVVSFTGTIDGTITDATLTDAKVTDDKVDFTATINTPQGEIKVVTDTIFSNGVWAPTAGGVATNFIHHGVSKWGTQLMPTVFTSVAFWGLGTIFKDGEMIDEKVIVHMMVTEFTRGVAPYKLATDSQIKPEISQLHVIVLPFDVQPDGGIVQRPVNTGFELPNGVTLPFLHVMFPNITIEASSAAGDERIKVLESETETLRSETATLRVESENLRAEADGGFSIAVLAVAALVAAAIFGAVGYVAGKGKK